MSLETVSSLYPSAGPLRPLQGLCLKHRLVEQGSTQQPYLYASYIMSANGAIALPTSSGKWARPRTLSDPRDLQFLYELLIQADCFITSGSYLRDLHHGELGDILQLTHLEQFPYLHEYREQNHEHPYPQILAISHNLDFPVPAPCVARTRILTPANADAERVRALEHKGVTVVRTEEEGALSCDTIMAELRKMGCHTAYLLCGPGVGAPLMQHGHVRRLYLSWLHRLHGGHPVLTIGSHLTGEAPLDMTLGELYQMEERDGLPGLWLGYFEL